MEEKDIKALANEAYVLQQELNKLEEKLWDNIKSEVRAKSSFGEYASLIRIVFHTDSIHVNVFDCGYDLYETETIIFTHDQLSELMP